MNEVEAGLVKDRNIIGPKMFDDFTLLPVNFIEGQIVSVGEARMFTNKRGVYTSERESVNIKKASDREMAGILSRSRIKNLALHESTLPVENSVVSVMVC